MGDFDDTAEALERRRQRDARLVDASDETRLAAGWVQEVAVCDPARDRREMFETPGPWLGDGRNTPAPGPAGKWRLHPAGVWVRWVIA